MMEYLADLAFADHGNLFQVNVFVSNHCHHKHSFTTGPQEV